jgi:hypothetical protein
VAVMICISLLLFKPAISNEMVASRSHSLNTSCATSRGSCSNRAGTNFGRREFISRRTFLSKIADCAFSRNNVSRTSVWKRTCPQTYSHTRSRCFRAKLERESSPRRLTPNRTNILCDIDKLRARLCDFACNDNVCDEMPEFVQFRREG